ncbi:MAG: hypothetical protein HUU35_11950, partial [Armatimonadetes bacterium]|nr:hypothetical protein [Armatimonadota bacterium]
GLVGLNVCRDRTLTQDREWSCWSQVNANFHDPLRFGHVLLSADPADAGKQAEALRKGERQGPLRVFGRAGYGQESYAALARSTLQRAEQRTADFRRLRETAEAGEAEALGRRLKPLEERLEAIRKALAGEVDGAAYAKAELALSGLISELETAYWDARLEALLKSL